MKRILALIIFHVSPQTAFAGLVLGGCVMEGLGDYGLK